MTDHVSSIPLCSPVPPDYFEADPRHHLISFQSILVSLKDSALKTVIPLSHLKNLIHQISSVQISLIVS